MSLLKFSCSGFGDRLEELKDTDPVVSLVYTPKWSKQTLRKWLLAYGCFNNVGVACWVADESGTAYWDRMLCGAGSKKTTATAKYLASRKLDALIKDLGATDCMSRVTGWKGFTEQSAFRLISLASKLQIVDFEFQSEEIKQLAFLVEGAVRLWEAIRSPQEPPKRRELVAWALSWITHKVGKSKLVPPTYHRSFGDVEAAIVLQKWNLYMEDEYTLGQDVANMYDSLTKVESTLSDSLLDSLVPNKPLLPSWGY